MMPFSVTFKKFGPVAPNLHNIVFNDVILKLIKCNITYHGIVVKHKHPYYFIRN